MSDRELVDTVYFEATSGLTENILRDAKLWYAHIISLPAGYRTCYMIGILNRQVMNGGFHQYFFNGYGIFAYETVSSLIKIGANRTAGILERVIERINASKYPEALFRDKIANRQLIEIVGFDQGLINFLDKHDQEYYEDTEDLEYLLANFLRKH